MLADLAASILLGPLIGALADHAGRSAVQSPTTSFLLAGPELVIGINAVTFAASAVLLLGLRGHVRAAREDGASGSPSAARRSPASAASSASPPSGR